MARKPCTVSHLPPPIRKPPPRIMRDWEDPPPNALIERSLAYVALRLVTSENAHSFHQEPIETVDEEDDHQ